MNVTLVQHLPGCPSVPPSPGRLSLWLPECRTPEPPPLPPPGLCICFSSARNVLLLPPKAIRPSLKPCPLGGPELCLQLCSELWAEFCQNAHLHKSNSTGQKRCPGLSTLWLNEPSDSCLIIQSHGLTATVTGINTRVNTEYGVKSG